MLTKDEDYIRNLVLRGFENNVRALLVSKTQSKILQIFLFTGEKLRSREIADNLNISVQNVDCQLTKLTYKGYLRRCKITNPSGGHEWLYTLEPTRSTSQ